MLTFLGVPHSLEEVENRLAEDVTTFQRQHTATNNVDLLTSSQRSQIAETVKNLISELKSHYSDYALALEDYI